MRIELHERPLEPAPAVLAPARKSARERRWERRRRRVIVEEVLGWILVPLILVGAYWVSEMVLAALGTSPSAVWQGVSAFLSY